MKPMDGDSESRSQSTSQAPHLWFVLTIFTQALKRKRPKQRLPVIYAVVLACAVFMLANAYGLEGSMFCHLEQVSIAV